MYMKKSLKLLQLCLHVGDQKVSLEKFKKLNKKPLIFYSIKNLINIKDIDRIILSSDSKKILKTVKKNFQR